VFGSCFQIQASSMRSLKWPELVDLRFADEAGEAVYIASFYTDFDLYNFGPLSIKEDTITPPIYLS